MWPFQSKATTSTEALQRAIVFVCAFCLYLATASFLMNVGIDEAMDKVRESYRPGSAELLIALFCLPAVYAISKFICTEYRVDQRVPRLFRLSALVLNLLARSMCSATCFYIYLFSLRFLPQLPIEVLASIFFGSMLAGFVWWVMRATRQRAAQKTVIELYESLLRNDLSACVRLCEPEVVERFSALESRIGKLDSYEIVDKVTDEIQTSYMVQAMRSDLPRFEEVLLRPDGRRVVQLTALGA